MLLEQAEALVIDVMPDMNTPAHLEREIRLALDQYRRWGLTGVHDAGSDLTEIGILKKLAARGELPLRVYAMASGEAAVEHYLANGPEVGLADDQLTIRSFKIMVDGALGARGAQLTDPYSDDPDTHGLPQMNDAEIDAFIAAARASGFQVNAHVIGDLGVERYLDAIERNGVPAADSGDPRTTLNSLLNRSGFDGAPEGGWFPQQAVDVDTALRLMSAGNAYAAFEEDRFGALTVGRYADFTVLAADPRMLPPADLLTIGVTMTVVGGKVTFEQ